MKRIPLGVVAATGRSPLNWFLGICPLAFLIIISASAAADAQTSTRELTAAEQWVVAQAAAGGIADLNKQFPNEADRQLSADFLETLLMGTRPDLRLHRHDVRIKGACVDEPIDLENAQIPCDVWLEHCQFNASVTSAGANFAANASFQGSTFNAEANS